MEQRVQPFDPFKLCSVGTVRRLLLEHQIRPSKAMGQSFIVNRSALERIVNSAELKPDEGAFEIGTGFGTLTAALAQKCRVVVSLEKDRHLFSVAETLLKPLANVRLICDDALTADWEALIREHGEVARWKFVSNLALCHKQALAHAADEGASPFPFGCRDCPAGSCSKDDGETGR
jgi:16S rRNA (adenine1518-N6/adenine1519-N6)-dimethyltransferase